MSMRSISVFFLPFHAFTSVAVALFPILFFLCVANCHGCYYFSVIFVSKSLMKRPNFAGFFLHLFGVTRSLHILQTEEISRVKPLLNFGLSNMEIYIAIFELYSVEEIIHFTSCILYFIDVAGNLWGDKKIQIHFSLNSRFPIPPKSSKTDAALNTLLSCFDRHFAGTNCYFTLYLSSGRVTTDRIQLNTIGIFRCWMAHLIVVEYCSNNQTSNTHSQNTHTTSHCH